MPNVFMGPGVPNLGIHTYVANILSTEGTLQHKFKTFFENICYTLRHKHNEVSILDYWFVITFLSTFMKYERKI